MTKIAQDLLEKIATGSGRAYPHEAKQMALELLEFRKARDDAAKTSAPQTYGYGLYGPHP
jgi:hypothetical protein